MASRPLYVPAIALSPGTRQTASSAKSPRSAKLSLRSKAPKSRRTTSALRSLAAPTRRLPAVDQPGHVAALRVGELEAVEQPPRLVRVVVRHRRLEALPERRRLAQLPAKPAEQADGRLIGHLRGRLLRAWTSGSRSRR